MASPPLQFPRLQQPASPAAADSDAFQTKISPSILLIILILAVIFFISGLLHLLIRFLLHPRSRDLDADFDSDDSAGATAFQGRLQQLFHLHDAGVDQAFIDTLPIFHYSNIVGAGGTAAFDCAVCLCEFAADDRLRLLPKCSHAFHVDCIDTWLLSHSTCPLCRRSLFPEFSPPPPPPPPPHSGCSPLMLVLESDTSSSRRSTDYFTAVDLDVHDAAAAGAGKEDAVVVSVKLGKFRSGAGAGSSATAAIDGRRCFSMGTYEYVMDESSFLQVAVKPPKKKLLPQRRHGSHRAAVSECDWHSKREGFKGFELIPKSGAPATVAVAVADDGAAAKIHKESYSISKIWLRSHRGGATEHRRAVSFRLPAAPSAPSECGSAGEWDVEVASSIGSRVSEAPSLARRTLLWIMGRHGGAGGRGAEPFS